MDFCTAYGGCVPVTGFDKSLTINTYSFPEAIWVDLDGKRFCDETKADSKVKSDSWTEAKDNIVFSIFPASVKTAENNPFLGVEDGWAKLEELAAEGKYVFKAESVEELAKLAGIDAAALTATISQYNADAAAGKDSVHGRTDALVPVEGTIYAVYTIPYVLITSGGVAINENAQMLREDGSAICRLPTSAANWSAWAMSADIPPLAASAMATASPGVSLLRNRPLPMLVFLKH